MSTTREEIKSKLTIQDGKIIPLRETSIEEEKSILDQEYHAMSGNGNEDYLSADINDIQTTTDVNSEDVEDKVITHTDIYRFDGKDIPVIVAKTTTAVLDRLAEGKYQAVSFSVDFSKADSVTVEQGVRDFRPKDTSLPRGKRGVTAENGLIIVEPAINGFKMSVLLEGISEESYRNLMRLQNAILDVQGYILENTLMGLRAKGVPAKELIKNQASIGVVPRARRAYEKDLADGNPITREIRVKGRVIADNLNEELNLMPLTGQTVEFGLQVFTVEVTTKAANWHSSNSNISYFKKGDTQGRIVRITGSKRKIPVLNEIVPEVSSIMTKLAIWAASLFEDIARDQLGYTDREPVREMIDEYKNEHINVCDLFGVSADEVYNMSKDMFDKAKAFMKDKTKANETKMIASILSSFGGSSPKEE